MHSPSRPAPLTITADALVRKAGDANPPLTASYAGFVNGDSVSDLDAPVVLVTSATIGSAVGSYPITLSGATDANYAITFVPGTLTVTDKELPVIGWATPPAPVAYGTPLEAKNLSATSKVPGTFTYSPPLGTVLHAGNDQVVWAIFTPDDPTTYASVRMQAVFDVLPKDLTIRANDKTITAGEAPLAITASYAGFVNGDSASDLDTPAQFNTTATASSPPGTYPIIASAAADNDYTPTFVAGTLTIAPKTTSTYQVLLPLIRK